MPETADTRKRSIRFRASREPPSTARSGDPARSPPRAAAASVRAVKSRRSSRFVRFAWTFCAYLLFVILFGAWVRITHSGAGCGSHWPTCNGEIIPLSPSWETVVEYTHRLTSGLLGVFGIVLVGWAARQSRRVLGAALVTFAFIVVEALIGAGLVLRELVADDASGARAIVIALHLANTLVLTGAAALVAWWGHDVRPVAWTSSPRAGRRMLLVLAVLVLTAVTGAITALGDTLFPVQHGLVEGGGLGRLRDDLSAANHFLVRLRIVHPVIAVSATGIVLLITAWLREPGRCDATTVKLATGLRHLAVTQLVLGIINIGLAAPGWMQLLHLLVAQALWMIAVLTWISAISVSRES